MSTENLWGKIDLTVKLDTPAVLLKQQANALEKATRGLLSGRVQPYNTNDPNQIGHELRIVAPALANYSVAIVSVAHDITLYPASVLSDVDGEEMGEARNPEELKDLLRLVLQSEKVKKIVHALIAQSVAEESSDRS
jgi:hypothetical protein